MSSHSAVAVGEFPRALPDAAPTLRRLICRSLALVAFALGAWLLGAMFAAGHAGAAPVHQHAQASLAGTLKAVTHAPAARSATHAVPGTLKAVTQAPAARSATHVVPGALETTGTTLVHVTAPVTHSTSAVTKTVIGTVAKTITTTVQPALKTSPLEDLSRPATTDGVAVRSTSVAVHHAEPAANHAPVAGSARVPDRASSAARGGSARTTVPNVPTVPVGPQTPSPNTPAPTGPLNSFSHLGAVDVSTVPALRIRSIPTTARGADRLPGLLASQPSVFPD